MKIVILDGYTANPGDLSWEPFSRFGTLTVHDRTDPPAIPARAGDAEVILTNKTPLDQTTIDALPHVRYIGVLATGANMIDRNATRARGITVCNVPGYSTPSVAQATMALLLHLTNHVAVHDDAVHGGAWSASPDFCFTRTPLLELHGKRMGLVGYGAIGRQVGEIARAMGMEIAATLHTPRTIPGVRVLPLESLLETSDVISLHCPLTEETRGMIHAERLARMKPTAILLNTSRGDLIREDDLAAALQAGTIAGAGLDVLATEPPPADHPLLHVPRCVITPHIAWATRESRARLLEVAAANLAAFLDGTPQNVLGD